MTRGVKVRVDRFDRLTVQHGFDCAAVTEADHRHLYGSALGEAKFRRGLKEAEERAEQFRQWQVQQRHEDLERRNAERLKHLRDSGELLRQAEDLRALIVRVRSAITAGSAAISPARLEEWESWASAEADRIDPLLSGQIMTHLDSTGE